MSTRLAMGGKTKNVQRTKNNAKPSSSARSAELLSIKPSFVGFSSFTEMTLAPGFGAAIENAPEVYDANVASEFQLVLRKLTKKDAMTKQKGLQEFISLVEKTELDVLKSILPHWPKLYKNLANDIDYRVREFSQTALKVLACKCKRALAPYLKQLMPVWLGSCFDNYAPAASIAMQCFRDTFTGSGDRTQEVCLHCQTEIVEYVVRNLTFHSAATLSQDKGLTEEEAEQKYQRLMLCSLHELSFLVEHTAQKDAKKLCPCIEDICKSAKFWNFSKSRQPPIRAAWFQLMCQLIQNPQLLEVLAIKKTELIAVSFQHIDESQPLVAPHIWECVLLLQTKYDDWHATVNMRKQLLPKLAQLLRQGFNNNAQAVCPNILPFYSKLSPAILPDVNMIELHKQFFDDLKTSLVAEKPASSKADYAAMAKTYFECLRYLCQKLNSDGATGEAALEAEQLALSLLHDNVLALIAWCLSSEYSGVKFVLSNAAALVPHWTQRHAEGNGLYGKLLQAYWSRIYATVTKSLSNAGALKDCQLEHLSDYLRCLQKANSSLESEGVKFSESAATGVPPAQQQLPSVNSKAPLTASYVQRELLQLVVRLVRLCIDNTAQHKMPSYLRHLRSLVDLYDDLPFYEQISEAGTLPATLEQFTGLIERLDACDECEIVIEMIFKMLSKLASRAQFDYIESELLQLPQRHAQVWVLQHLLTYPLCVEPQVRVVLSKPDCCRLIRYIADSAVNKANKQHLQLLHKCFFQTLQDEILIGQQTVADILHALSSTLSDETLSEMTDDCGSFIAQILPVVCSKQNATITTKYNVFVKLFSFSLRLLGEEEYLSEDTLWEITTSWQDALSSGDIQVVPALLEACAEAVDKALQQMAPLDLEFIQMLADALSKFILCATETIGKANVRSATVDSIMSDCFAASQLSEESVQQLSEFCLLLEALNDKVTLGVPLGDDALWTKWTLPYQAIFQRALVNFSTIINLLGHDDDESVRSIPSLGEDDEDSYCTAQGSARLPEPYSDALVGHILDYLYIASMGSALQSVQLQLTPELDAVIDELHSQVTVLMRHSATVAAGIKERLLATAAQGNITACRALKFLVHTEHFRQFEESATLLLAEELAEYFMQQRATKAYVYSLQYLLPHLEQGTFTPQSAIMKAETKELWLRAAAYRCLIRNNFAGDTMTQTHKSIIAMALTFITEVSERQSTSHNVLLYNVEIHKKSSTEVVDTVEYVLLLCAVLEHFPTELTLKNWDVIRVALSSWVLSVIKSIKHITNPKAATYVVAVYRLYATLTRYVRREKQKSSTEMLSNIIEEWENVFSREVNLVLFTSFFELCTSPLAHSVYEAGSEAAIVADRRYATYASVVEQITESMEYIDYAFVYQFCESSQRIPLEDLCAFLLKNLSNPVHRLRLCCVHMMRALTQKFVAHDVAMYDQQSESVEQQGDLHKWHFLNRFEDYLGRYELPLHCYLDEFSFKLNEIADFQPIVRHEAFSYLLLWDCMMYACANAPTPLRALYTNWLNENKYDETFLRFLFRAMPAEVLKNHDSKFLQTDSFRRLTWSQLKERQVSVEKYVCHMYIEVLCKLPALVRRWWNTSPSRQKTFVDKLTTHFVSLYICNEELKAISGKKEKHENMQVSVHNSTREVLAVYAIEDSRMELVITLAQNYPLSGVKVECGKQIGGRTASRNLGMQLTIFLTHQNGTIFDGLTMWKNNLDKKFEGVEECYVCYTVIHQDTCQLPKLFCKTCKKKFHAPCLYKWFTTSSKSTCPICRNVF